MGKLIIPAALPSNQISMQNDDGSIVKIDLSDLSESTIKSIGEEWTKALLNRSKKLKRLKDKKRKRKEN